MNDGRIEEYMAEHQHDSNADDLWLYFQNVMNWVKAKFPKKRKEMKQVAWGVLYNKHKDDKLDAAELENKIAALMKDSDVQKKSGIYAYVLDGDEHHLGIRAFDDNTRREVYERQSGICKICGKHFEIEQMEADHITPWYAGGRTIADNSNALSRMQQAQVGQIARVYSFIMGSPIWYFTATNRMMKIQAAVRVWVIVVLNPAIVQSQ